MKEKILFILPSLCGGGAEKTVANLSFSLSKKYEVLIAVFNDTETKYSHSGRLIKLGKSKKKNILTKILFTIIAITKIKRIKKEQNVDYSISFLATADLVNVLSKRKGTKTIISIRNTDSLNHRGSINYFFTKFSCRKADHIISISEQVKKDLIEVFKIKSSKITTIYNPALKIKFGQNTTILADSFFNNPVFINIGRLTKQKGQWHLIKAFSLVVQSHKEAKLVILGKGELREKLESIIKHYKLEKNVFLIGFVKDPYTFLTKSRCFVFSSLYEGLGNSILEAITCSTPVISTDCIAGPREILAPKTNWGKKISNGIDYAEYGILVPCFDNTLDIDNIKITPEEKILAKAIEKMIDDNQLYIKYKKQSQRRSKDFDTRIIAKEWETALTSCKADERIK